MRMRLAATFLPGAAAVPRALAIMLMGWRLSAPNERESQQWRHGRRGGECCPTHFGVPLCRP